MITVLVTGAKGQLGRSIQSVASNYLLIQFDFADSNELDITNIESISNYFKGKVFDYCINCAAYTNVEQAEKKPAPAFDINATGTENLAKACYRTSTTIIHISTDYVFDGEKRTPYTVDDKTNPINEYGKSKLEGEIKIKEILNEYYIVRTSWLYSEFGDNFYKSILKKAKTEDTLRVIDSQTGCPTNALNLAKFLIESLILGEEDYGVHHFTDGVPMTWYSFAKKILIENNINQDIKLEKAKDFSTFAKRPLYSVLK